MYVCKYAGPYDAPRTGFGMTASLGTLPLFRPGRGDFDVYLERFKLFAAANNISEGKVKQQVFLTALDDEAYLTLRTLLLPKSPPEASFEESALALKNHYSPRLPLVAERYKFNCRNQEPYESVSDFIVQIKRLAAQCEFGTFLPELLRDRFISGLQDDVIRRHLLAMPDVSFDRACAVAKSMETQFENGTSPEVDWREGQISSSNPADDFTVQCGLVEGDCQTRHARRFVDCASAVIYEIPLTCEKVYVGQTGRCVNDRLREHAAAMNVSFGARLTTHCGRCGCQPIFEATRILEHLVDPSTRVMFEACHIRNYGPDKCISEPSVKLLEDGAFFS